MKQAMHNLELAKKIGADRFLMLAGMVHLTFLKLMTDILGMSLEEISPAQNVVIGNETQECYADFLNKYEHFDGRNATDEENQQFRDDLLDCMVKAAKKLKLRSMTRERIEQQFDKALAQSNANTEAFADGK